MVIRSGTPGRLGNCSNMFVDNGIFASDSGSTGSKPSRTLKDSLGSVAFVGGIPLNLSHSILCRRC